MPAGLFARLTSREDRGAALFGALVRIAREHGWFVEGQVPDTLDGRFAVLASVAALVIVRLEAGGEVGQRASVALTERFIEAMDNEHRQMGIGDPTLGKTVRKLVGSLAARVALWREAIAGEDWRPAVVESVYRDNPPAPAAIAFSDTRLAALWASLQAASDETLAQGDVQ